MHRRIILLLTFVSLVFLAFVVSSKDFKVTNSGRAVAQTTEEIATGGLSLSSTPGSVQSNPLAIPSTPGTIYQTFSGLFFRPYMYSLQFAYNFTLGNLYLINSGGEVFVPISLPDKVQVAELTYSFRDASATHDMVLGLCRIPIGGSAMGCVAWTVNASGVNDPGVTTRTLSGSPIFVVDNTNYSYSLLGYLPIADSAFGIVSARVGYTLPSYLPIINK